MAMKGAYRGCPWCGGTGCIQCPSEAEKAQAARFEPIAEFDTTTKDGVEAAKRAIGAKAMKHAFGPGGNGVREIKVNCLIEKLK